MTFIKVLLFIVLTTCIYEVQAQRHGVFLGLGVNYTVGGPIGDIHTGIELNRHLIGILYSEKILLEENKYNPSSKFIGLTYQFTTYREEHFQLGFQFRSGFIDQEFLVYFPALIFDFVFNDYWKFTINLGVRGRKPAYGFLITFNLPTTKNEFPHSIGSK